MFLLNDNNNIKPKNLSLKLIFSDSKKKKNSFNDKIFIPRSPFESGYSQEFENDMKNKNNIIPYNPNNTFCPKIQNNLRPSNNTSNYINLNNLSTNQNSNIYNHMDEQNNNNYISQFNPGNTNPNPSVNFLKNSGNILPELNNNKNKEINKSNQNNQENLKVGFNPLNYPISNYINNPKDINYFSNIFPKKPNNNNQTFPCNDHNINDIYKNEPNDANPNINLNIPDNIVENKGYPSKIIDNLNQEQMRPNIIYDNNYNNNDINNPNKNNLNLNTSRPKDTNSNNNMNNNYKTGYDPLDINVREDNKDNDSSQEIIIQNHSIRTSLDNNEILELEKNNNKGNKFLKSLIYGILFGSTATCLIWLRNEGTRKYLYEKYGHINFDSIMNFFKSFLHPVDFFQKIFSEDKRQVYAKVLGLTFGQFYDFLEKYGDEFRLIGLFLSIYAIWYIIKSVIKLAFKAQKQNKKN